MKAEIICDSINVSNGARLTTYILEFQRFVLAELATHRVFSKNSASSRAIPFEKFVEMVKTDPAMPVYWGSHNKGMQSGEELDDEIEDQYYYGRGKNDIFFLDREVTKRQKAKNLWLDARDKSICFAKELNDLGVHKSLTNRLLEPWFNIRVILSATEYDNFFKLRAHKDAQPEIQALAYAMLDAYKVSTPKEIRPGDWHIPFGDKLDEERLIGLMLPLQKNSTNFSDYLRDLKIRVAISRAARTSYFNYEGKDDYEADIKLCDRLFQNDPKHLSPTEHVAQAVEEDGFIGNFRGWKQYRKFIE